MRNKMIALFQHILMSVSNNPTMTAVADEDWSYKFHLPDTLPKQRHMATSFRSISSEEYVVARNSILMSIVNTFSVDIDMDVQFICSSEIKVTFGDLVDWSTDGQDWDNFLYALVSRMTAPKIMTSDIIRILHKLITALPGDENTIMVELERQYLVQNWIQSLAMTGIVHYLNKK